MKAIVPVVHRSRAVRAALRRGLPRGAVRVVACRSLERVRWHLARELVDAVVVDVAAGWVEAAFAIAGEFPGIPVFAFSLFRPDDGRLLASCHAGGLRGVIVEGVDDPVAGELIRRRSATAARRRALRDAPRLLRLTEDIQRRAWEEVLSRAGGPMTTSTIAGAVGRTREHLSREFAAGGAPNLKRVIDLARASWAADLLANPGYSVSGVARILGYSSASHLAGSVRRVAGVTPQVLGRLGPEGVLQRFIRGRMRSRL